MNGSKSFSVQLKWVCWIAAYIYEVANKPICYHTFVNIDNHGKIAGINESINQDWRLSVGIVIVIFQQYCTVDPWTFVFLIFRCVLDQDFHFIDVMLFDGPALDLSNDKFSSCKQISESHKFPGFRFLAKCLRRNQYF